MKYISIDIETTGLDPEKNQILEFAAVYDDLQSPIEQLPRFVRKIKWDDYVINEFCLDLHGGKGLLNEIKNGGNDVIYIDQLVPKFRMWLSNSNILGYYNVAGKNFAGFDGQFLKRVFNFPPWHYRVIDVGSMYLEKTMSKVPGLGGIIGGIAEHRALPDALAVVQAIRKKLLPERCKAVGLYSKLDNSSKRRRSPYDAGRRNH